MSSDKKQAKLLLTWAEQNFLEQVINTPTRGYNILDLVFTNSSNLTSGYSTIINRKFSDHNILKVKLNYEYKNDRKVKRKNPYPNKIYEYDLMNAIEEDWIRYEVLMSKLSETFEEQSRNENTEEKLTRFYNIVEKAVVTLFEKKEAFKSEDEKEKKQKNRIPKEMRKLMMKKSCLSKKIISSCSEIKTLKLMKTLEQIENELEVNYKRMKLKKEGEALGKIKRNPKYFYSYANKFSKIKTRVGPLADSNGETVKDPYLMAEMLKKQYESTFSDPVEGQKNQETEEEDKQEEEDKEEEGRDEDNSERRDQERPGSQEPRGQEEGEEGRTTVSPDEEKLTDVHFDFMDIVDAIGQLDLCSGPGPDGISAILLKKAKITVALIFQNIFRHSLDNSEIPSILKLGFICPILKPNCNRERPASWRPVSLTSHVIKTFERVIRRRIINHLEGNNLLDNDQHGSRKGRTCLSQLLQHQDEILRKLEEGQNVDVIYTDFEKAYEKVDHAKLEEKMKNQFGIEGKLGKWLHCFLEKRKQQIVIEETKSEKSDVKSGAIQGSVLGPVFFLMFISDIQRTFCKY